MYSNPPPVPMYCCLQQLGGGRYRIALDRLQIAGTYSLAVTYNGTSFSISPGAQLQVVHSSYVSPTLSRVTGYGAGMPYDTSSDSAWQPAQLTAGALHRGAAACTPWCLGQCQLGEVAA
jgi:hypothetical protein